MREKTVAVAAIFASRQKAEGAVDELGHQGFSRDQIGLAAPSAEPRPAIAATEALEKTAADGAVSGALAGGALGAATGAAVVSLIPGIGPVLGIGLLLGMSTGAAAGAFAGPFAALGFTPEAVEHYQADIKSGRCLLVVRTDDPEKAAMVLRSQAPESVEIARPSA
jgi:hypothetical protein